MSTDTHHALDDAAIEPPAGAGTPDAPRRPWARPLLAAAAVAVLAGAGIGIWQATGSDEPATPPLALTVTPSDPATAMCMAFDPAQLSGVEVAFAGTATAVADGTVTVEVSEVFRGDVPGTVTLDAGPSAALDGVSFEAGKRYLISAAAGTVGVCGSSGPDEPTLRAAYEQVFGKR